MHSFLSIGSGLVFEGKLVGGEGSKGLLSDGTIHSITIIRLDGHGNEVSTKG